MLKSIDWINIAEIVSKDCIKKSLSVLWNFKNELKAEKINDFIISIITKMNNDDKSSILCSQDFSALIGDLSKNTIWNYKTNNEDSLLKNILILLNRDDNKYFIKDNENALVDLDNLLETILNFSSIEHIREHLCIKALTSHKEQINIDTISLLIRLGLYKSLLKLMDKGFTIFDSDERMEAIPNVQVLKIFLGSGETLNKKIYKENEILPLWVVLLYKNSSYITLPQHKKDLKNYIIENISEKELRKEEVKRYWKKWEQGNDPSDYFDSIEGWETLKTESNQNVLIKLIEHRCNKINSLYRKKEFLEHLNESDNEGKNIWGYLLGFYETKNNKLSEKIIPYLKENGIYPTINKKGQGLLRQSKAMLDISNKSNVEKFILKTFDNTIWLGDEDEQLIFANEICEKCLSMDKLRNREYKYIVDYITNFIDMTSISKELLYAIVVFYGIMNKPNIQFEDKISFSQIICPSDFIDKQDIFIKKINSDSRNTSQCVTTKLKEAKIYTKIIMKTITHYDKISTSKKMNTKRNRI